MSDPKQETKKKPINNFHRLAKRGKKIIRKGILREFKAKQKRVESIIQKEYKPPPMNRSSDQATNVTGSILQNKGTTFSIDNNVGSTDLEQIPIDPYYTTTHNAYVRPAWRKRRPMVVQNKWRKRPKPLPQQGESESNNRIVTGTNLKVYWWNKNVGPAFTDTGYLLYTHCMFWPALSFGTWTATATKVLPLNHLCSFLLPVVYTHLDHQIVHPFDGWSFKRSHNHKLRRFIQVIPCTSMLVMCGHTY